MEKERETILRATNIISFFPEVFPMPIDFHVHVFPDQLAEKAVQNIFQITKNPPSTDGTLSDTLAHMDQ